MTTNYQNKKKRAPKQVKKILSLNKRHFSKKLILKHQITKCNSKKRSFFQHDHQKTYQKNVILGVKAIFENIMFFLRVHEKKKVNGKKCFGKHKKALDRKNIGKKGVLEKKKRYWKKSVLEKKGVGKHRKVLGEKEKGMGKRNGIAKKKKEVCEKKRRYWRKKKMGSVNKGIEKSTVSEKRKYWKQKKGIRKTCIEKMY